MTYSCTDFTDDVINRLIELDLIKKDIVPADDTQEQANIVLRAIDSLASRPAGSPAAAPGATRIHVLIQEGGSSTELYLHAWDTAEEASDDRIACARDGAYRTSDVVEVDSSLGNVPQTVEGWDGGCGIDYATLRSWSMLDFEGERFRA
ncbi:hypothetical protein, partial [Paraburkholderia phenoliruptrix]